jgi:hypothetical protein
MKERRVTEVGEWSGREEEEESEGICRKKAKYWEEGVVI